MSRIIKIFTLLLVLGLFVSGCAVSKDTPRETPQDQAAESQDENAAKPSQNNGDDGASPQDILKNKYYFYEINKPMEDFEAEDLNGNKVKLSDYKGKIIFLNFWATWCPPCRAEMPHMEEFYEEYKDEDVVVLAVSSTSVELRGGTDDKAAEKKVRSFIQEHGYTFPVLLDRDDEAWKIYYRSVVPANYIIDKEGIVRYFKMGAFSGKQEMELAVKAIRALEE
ncbi:TlpA disulfide reductase family protein [Caldicoprobacter faecalis]|uniref:Cytochrome c-type biogenesis protein n=1 Tax=Caldicoprobacter faecalis TaxID=937334 RepID=A0A1I5W0U8_9FIRM|nr:TlpA disulfide reductase family protein [Caldicoprobacter faecalis]SFQ13227.1 cytochrome c-type biogenesis protein [Caldicoprobacter faecalis]